MRSNSKSAAPLAQGLASQLSSLHAWQSRRIGRRTVATTGNPAPFAAADAEVISLGDIASHILERLQEVRR
jgi:hypothetical protein